MTAEDIQVPDYKNIVRIENTNSGIMFFVTDLHAGRRAPPLVLVMVTTNLLVQLSLLIAAQAQAPGDGATFCLAEGKTAYPSGFNKNVIPLMDSYDYLSLITPSLPGTDTWMGVDADGDGHYVSVSLT